MLVLRHRHWALRHQLWALRRQLCYEDGVSGYWVPKRPLQDEIGGFQAGGHLSAHYSIKTLGFRPQLPFYPKSLSLWSLSKTFSLGFLHPCKIHPSATFSPLDFSQNPSLHPPHHHHHHLLLYISLSPLKVRESENQRAPITPLLQWVNYFFHIFQV